MPTILQLTKFNTDLPPKIPPDTRDRILPPLGKGEFDPNENQDLASFLTMQQANTHTI